MPEDTGDSWQAAEKFEIDRKTVAQALSPVLILLHLLVVHSQGWLCHPTFSAAC
jgi:hypothetical protein